MNDKLEIYQDNANEWRWRIIASNGEIIGASTEGYINQSDCLNNAHREQQGNDEFEIYHDKADEWRWRIIASNGEIVRASTAGYINRSDCVDNAQRNGFICF